MSEKSPFSRKSTTAKSRQKKKDQSLSKKRLETAVRGFSKISKVERPMYLIVIECMYKKFLQHTL